MSQVMTQPGPGTAAARIQGGSPQGPVAAVPTIAMQTGPGMYRVPGGVLGRAAGGPAPAPPGILIMQSTASSNNTPPAGQVQHPLEAGCMMMMGGNSQGSTTTTGSATGGGPIVLTNGTCELDPDNGDLANTKEKTPMCLINELARYNKIQHQYTLTDEQGPAHKKTFFVKLKLGDEEYAASGQSIKKAQHAAAAEGLEKTEYKHPPPKAPRKLQGGGDHLCFSESITPTVELNALVMKRGEPAMYRPIEVERPQYYPPPNLNFRGMYNQRYHYPRYPRVFFVSLKVGQREFIGDGKTRQAARHNAAAKALTVLRHLPLPNQDPTTETKTVSVGTTAAPNVPPTQEDPPESKPDDSNEEDSDDEKDALKSEISLVHEIALKRNLAVNFEVVKESGPPHMRSFITRCMVGDFSTDGEGNGKKISKKRAATLMLEKLKVLPSLPPTVAKPKKPPVKKKNRNLIKVNWKADPGYGVGINPISRLIQIQQAKREREPVYTLKAEKGMPRRREFVMEVQVGDQSCVGVGPNKKLAKRNAAEAMLQQLGYSRPSPQPSKPSIKQSAESPASTSDKKVTFMDADSAHKPVVSVGRQLVPGLILMPDGARLNGHSAGGTGPTTNGPGNMRNSNVPNPTATRTTAAIAKELLHSGSSPTAESMVKTSSKPSEPQQTSVVRPKQQLLYLADVLGFQVTFTDFPKGSNKNEYLSLVSLSTTPPKVSHGAGVTIEESHDIAALTALKELAEMGLDAVSTEKSILKKEDKKASGDGPHLKSDVGESAPANSADPSNK